MPDLPPIVIVSTNQPLPTPLLTPDEERSIWSDFLSLKISANTQRAYVKAVRDFFERVYQQPASPNTIAKFLTLTQSEAVFQVLNYRRQLIEANLAPSTINVRLSAIKSLVDYARKMGECHFNLTDVPGIKNETYRDTTGIGIEEFKGAISLPDRSTAIGARDYAILRLLWDNALRRNEIHSLNVGDFIPTGQLKILGKGKIQKTAIDLTQGALVAISEWLEWRDEVEPEDPLFISLSRNQYGHRLDGSNIYRLVRKFSEAAGVEKVVSPHRIRHSAITAYLDNSDGNIRAAQALSRHANLNTLTRYDDNRQQYQKKASDTLGNLLTETADLSVEDS
jgi:integrase/recombinase XerC